MVLIAPFRGIHYNSDVIEDLSHVITPPYDVISLEAREHYYQKHPYNIIRIILGKALPQDDKTNNKYTRASAFFQQWLSTGILKVETSPKIYLYEQDFYYNDGLVTRRGFVSLVRLEEFSSKTILPHEKTMDKPKEDRLQLLRTCKANFSQIFALYSDPSRNISKFLKEEYSKEPSIHIKDNEGVDNRIWPIDDPDLIQFIQSEMSTKTLFIADGHHRYETCLLYRDEMRSIHRDFTGKEPYNFSMMYLTNMDEEGLIILPCHRVLKNVDDVKFANLQSGLSKYFDETIIEFDSNDRSQKKTKFFNTLSRLSKKKQSFGMYKKGDTVYRVLTLKNEKFIDEKLGKTLEKPLKELDVVILDQIILGELLGISEQDIREEAFVSYTKNADQAFDSIHKGEAKLAFIMNPTKVEQVRAVARLMKKMPQKSTFFSPKLPTGLIINNLDANELLEI